MDDRGPSITVRALNVFPVKSLRGIAASQADVGDRGFRHDRRFMVVDEGGRFLTQRTLPRMALVQVAIDGQALRVGAPGQGTIEVPLQPAGGAARIVQVWRDQCESVSLGEGPASWLSEFLGRRCELVYMPDATLRRTDPRFGSGRVGFADAYPFLLASVDSLAEVARRGGGVPMERFRPNIVVGGAAPFAEDGWRHVRIGDVGFRVAKPCARCAITTVDPERGAVDGVEPLRTLRTFRSSAEGVLFGVNLVHEGVGSVSVGERVDVET